MKIKIIALFIFTTCSLHSFSQNQAQDKYYIEDSLFVIWQTKLINQYQWMSDSALHNVSIIDDSSWKIEKQRNVDHLYFRSFKIPGIPQSQKSEKFYDSFVRKTEPELRKELQEQMKLDSTKNTIIKRSSDSPLQ
jgi:hypothetical protein